MILLIATLLAVAAPAEAASAGPQQSVTVTAPHPLVWNDPLKDDTLIEKTVSDDTVVCHKNFATGSRLNVTTVCLTKRHWAELQHDQAKLHRPADGDETLKPGGLQGAKRLYRRSCRGGRSDGSPERPQRRPAGRSG